MQGVPVPRDELPAEVWQMLPANCTIRHDEEFFYLYQFEVLVVVLNKRADGATMARLLKIAEQLWSGPGSSMHLAHGQNPQRPPPAQVSDRGSSIAYRVRSNLGSRLQEGSTATDKRVSKMSETLIRESLIFGGAVLGAIWGYAWGRTAEYRRWRTVLEGLEFLRLTLNDTLSALDRFDNSSPTAVVPKQRDLNIAL
jgi:hypothetical protein